MLPRTLRALAARTDLRFGTAINMDLLGTDEKYTQIAAQLEADELDLEWTTDPLTGSVVKAGAAIRSR